ncbi:MAG TPA: YbhB/YbcL family Raf kinase inhibitor-like protein [Bryobacteraceae bacterium]|nr:YbhB/YbcL family Raf kinase inhibitor-like protein [Bryobacteraceae bacterium]
MAFKIYSSAFANGAAIPRLLTCDGADLSPALEWSGEPANTRSLVLIVDDPDAPGGVWTHWLLYDLPSSLRSLPQGYKAARPALSGVNDFGRPGYGGPCPPKGHGPHRYYFKLYALDVESLGLRPGAGRRDLERAMRGHVLAETQHMGRYERR